MSGGKEERRDVGVDIQAPVRVIDQGLFEYQERTHIPLCSRPVKGYPGTLKECTTGCLSSCYFQPYLLPSPISVSLFPLCPWGGEWVLAIPWSFKSLSVALTLEA